MRIFYIDYENVMDSGLNGIGKLTAADTVKIFYSEDAQRMSFGTHRRIIESKAAFLYQKISPDLKKVKNALDVLILQDLETTMKTDKSSDYFIVSKDNDFDSFIEEKLKKKYKIKRITEVCQASATKETSKIVQNSKPVSVNKSKDNAAKQKKAEQENAREKKEQVIRSYIDKNLREYEEWKEDIVEAYMESSSRQEFNRKLQQTFANEAVKEIFAGLKDLIKDMPGRID
jgi:hypothetical protein